MSMSSKGAPGTTQQRPTWEGPPENRPAGYLPADDNPEIERDAAGENLADPDRSDLSDAATTREAPPSREDRIRARAYRLWEQSGQPEGNRDDHWYQAERDIDQEEGDVRDADAAPTSEDDRRPREEFPPFDDPAFSPEPAQPPVQPDASGTQAVENKRYTSQNGAPEVAAEGHRNLGLLATPSPATEKTSGAGPAIAERSKDAKAPKGGRQPGAYIKD